MDMTQWRIFGSVSKRFFYQTEENKRQQRQQVLKIIAARWSSRSLLHVVAVSVLDTHITHTASLMLKRPLQCPRFRLQSHFIRFTFVSLMCLFHLLFFEAAEQNLNFKLFHFHTAAPWQLGNLPVSYVNALHLPRLVMRREQTKAYWRETFLVLCVWVWSKLWFEGKKRKNKQINKKLKYEMEECCQSDSACSWSMLLTMTGLRFLCGGYLSACAESINYCCRITQQWQDGVPLFCTLLAFCKCKPQFLGSFL